MNRYLCFSAIIDRSTMTFSGLSGKPPFEIEAANEADAVVIAKHQHPLAEGETMGVMFLGRILTGNAGDGMPVGQGGRSQKVEGTAAQ